MKNEKLIKVFLNNKEIFSENIPSTKLLNEIRNDLITNIRNEDFMFLDSDGFEIEFEDEPDYQVNDISNNNSIYLKSKSQISTIIPSSNPYLNYKSQKVSPSELRRFDLSKYKEIPNNFSESKILKLYLYSDKERKVRHENIYEYIYDEFDLNDYNTAYIVLFFGKIGDGKSAAINAFFNIVKGVKLEDEFRFILIYEKTQSYSLSISKTKGIHLYYIKDYNNKPVILIDCEGFGNCHSSLREDEKIIEALSYVFKNIINHVNAACFILKATNPRIDIHEELIFLGIKSLFSEDVYENFIFLASFANKETMRKGPDFINDLNENNYFSNIIKRIGKNYVFSFDSICLFDYDDIESRLTKFSYEQLKELFEKKIKLLNQKQTKITNNVVDKK